MPGGDDIQAPLDVARRLAGRHGDQWGPGFCGQCSASTYGVIGMTCNPSPANQAILSARRQCRATHLAENTHEEVRFGTQRRSPWQIRPPEVAQPRIIDLALMAALSPAVMVIHDQATPWPRQFP